MSESQIDLMLLDAAATARLGASLAGAFLRTRRAGAVLYFQGELGAGKTTCVRSLLRALGVTGLIRSPSYTLVEVYRPGDVPCLHVDLYRVGTPLEVAELGLRDYFDAPSLLLVEWPERGGAELPDPDLEVGLSYRDEQRHARIEAATAVGRGWLDILRNDASLSPYVTNLT